MSPPQFALASGRGEAHHPPDRRGHKVDGEEDLGVIRESLGVEPDIVIPKDGAVLAADRAGASPIDHDPGSPGMGKLRELAVLLLA